MSGMASGVGFSMANRAVDSIMGPRQVDMVHRNEDGSGTNPAGQAPPMSNVVSTNAGIACSLQQDQVNQCLRQAADMTHCQYYFDMLKQCQTAAP